MTDQDGLTPAQRVLWLDERGDWAGAHDLAQSLPDPDGARLHAYLHRVEGDLPNARYWYRRAGVAEFDGSLAEERRTLARQFG